MAPLGTYIPQCLLHFSGPGGTCSMALLGAYVPRHRVFCGHLDDLERLGGPHALPVHVDAIQPTAHPC